MFVEHTPATTRALEAAARWAHRQQADAVQPLHLLLGLIEEEEGRAAALLRRAGLELRRVRPAPLSERAPPLEVESARLPLDAVSQEALFHASVLCASLSTERVLASEHLLYVLLSKNAALRDHLTQLGLDWRHLEAEMRQSQAPPLVLSEPLQLEEPLHREPGVEEMETARILDAAANRAREALRVIEDYCRFVLDDALLSGVLKTLRHALASALSEFGPSLDTALAARETLHDVGTGISTAQEWQRASLLDVVQTNFKRLQETLRSLEEFGKLCGPKLGQALERLRYQSYTLERALVRGTTARQRLADVHLYLLITGSACAAGLDWTITEAIAGGVQMIQLREKDLTDRQHFERARQVRQWTRSAGLLLIINDRPDLARLVEADGVHLGQDDLSVKEARRILGPDALIGVSTHNLDQLRQAVLEGADYLGVGPTFPSGTKEFAELAGLDYVRQAMAQTSLPAFAIGGIDRSNIHQVLDASARRVAVSQAICKADEPRQAAAELRRALINSLSHGGDS